MQRRTSESWFRLVEDWQASGLTKKEFCAQQSIAYSGFHYWVKKFREGKSLPTSGSSFIPLKLTSGSLAKHAIGSVEVILPDGRRVNFPSGVDVGFLRELLS